MAESSWADLVLAWFRENRRDLPWRRAPTPYGVWISEIMLQQTVVQAVVSHYGRWMERFPDIVPLSEAGEQEVLTLWEGLGYYSRARNILRAARIIQERHGGKLPRTYAELTALPGIGEYTASAILSIAFSQPYPVVDANVRRLVCRLQAWREAPGDKILALLKAALPKDRPGAFNEALMELGQTICTARQPRCSLCPLKGQCQANRQGIQGEIPERKSRTVIRKETTVLLLLQGERILLVRRDQGLMAGLWLLPGVERGQPAEAYISQVATRLEAKGALRARTHTYTQYAERLHPVVYRVEGAHSLPEGARWVPLAQLGEYPVPSVYRRILGDLLARD